jgi:predicted HTH transcriptional regulator
MATVLDEAREMIVARIAELDAESESLNRALKELGGKATNKRGRPAGKASKAKPRRRRKGGPSRGEQAVKLIAENPGISASEIAAKMKIKPNYMYRVLSDETKRGTIKKKGRDYVPA